MLSLYVKYKKNNRLLWAVDIQLWTGNFLGQICDIPQLTRAIIWKYKENIIWVKSIVLDATALHFISSIVWQHWLNVELADNQQTTASVTLLFVRTCNYTKYKSNNVSAFENASGPVYCWVESLCHTGLRLFTVK